MSTLIHFFFFNFSPSISAIVGLSYLVQLPTILPPLLYTKKSESVCALFSRYLDTLKYVKQWNETDIFDPESDGYKGLVAVRSMHRHINKVMNATAGVHSMPSSVAPNVWVSQYDMVITQWAFYGLLLMFPEDCALYHVTEEEIYEIVYSWRVISHFIGIDDRFSLWCENLDKTQQLCHLIFDEVYRPVLEKDDRESVGSKMAEDIFTSMTPLLGPYTGQVANKYWYKRLGIEKELPLKTWQETLFYNFLLIMYGCLLKFNFIYKTLNWFMKWNIDRQIGPEAKKKAENKLKLNEEYTEIRYTFDDEVFKSKNRKGNGL